MNRHTRRRFLTGLAVVAAASVTLTACGSSDTGSSKSAGAGASKDYGLAQHGTITAAITAGDAPFVAPDANGKPAGMLVDLNDKIAELMHLKIVYKTTTVQAGLPALTSGQYDLMSVGLVQTPERKKSVAFTKSIYWGTNDVLVPSNSRAKTIADFDGKRIGAGAGSQQADFVNKKMTNAKPVMEATDSAGLSQLLAGNLDAVCLGSTHVSKVLKEHPGKLKIALGSPQDQPGAMAINKKLTTFLTDYNKQLTALVEDGTFLKLYDKYFPGQPFPTKMYSIWPQIQKQVEAQGSSAS